MDTFSLFGITDEQTKQDIMWGQDPVTDEDEERIIYGWFVEQLA